MDRRSVPVPVILGFEGTARYRGLQTTPSYVDRSYSFNVTFDSPPFVTQSLEVIIQACLPCTRGYEERLLGSFSISQSSHYSIN